MAAKTVTPPTTADVRAFIAERHPERVVKTRGRLSRADIEEFNGDKANKRNPYVPVQRVAAGGTTDENVGE